MWFKGDDKFHDHPKVQRLLQDGDGDAIALWQLAGTWCGDQLSDGLISAFVCGRWFSDWERKADALVGCSVRPDGTGLWVREEVDGRPHFRFHDWLDYNPSRERVLADRDAEKMRIALQRDVDLVAAIKKRDKNRCRYCGCLVKWGNQRGPAGATYDHILPVIKGGVNTLENVVIACRGCNSRKKHLTLEEAGMTLLRPGVKGAPAPEEFSATGSTPGSGLVGSGPENELSSPRRKRSSATKKSTTTRTKTRSNA